MTTGALLPGSTMHAERTVLDEALMSKYDFEVSRAGTQFNALLRNICWRQRQ